jgi:subtilisin-like proprotein convertase family protein
MLKGSLTFAICLLLAASVATAEKIGPGHAGDVYTPAGDCPVDNYKSFDGPGFDIPDNEPIGGGSNTGVIPDDGGTFTDIIVDIDMAHTWVGDLNIYLIYDMECTGESPEATAQIVCRPGQSDCDPAGTTFGCSDDLAGVYRFSDDGGTPLGVNCTGAQAAGCYGVSGPGLLASFDGMPKGGCMGLLVVDNAAGDTGAVSSWTLHALNDGGGTPTETVSWGDVKSRY